MHTYVFGLAENCASILNPENDIHSLVRHDRASGDRFGPNMPRSVSLLVAMLVFDHEHKDEQKLLAQSAGSNGIMLNDLQGEGNVSVRCG